MMKVAVKLRTQTQMTTREGEVRLKKVSHTLVFMIGPVTQNWSLLSHMHTPLWMKRSEGKNSLKICLLIYWLLGNWK